MAPAPRKSPGPSPQRRELYFFTLYRMLEAALLALVAFSPAGEYLLQIRQPALLQSVVMLYVVAAITLLVAGYRSELPPSRQAATISAVSPLSTEGSLALVITSIDRATGAASALWACTAWAKRKVWARARVDRRG